MADFTEEKLYQILKKHFELYYDSCYYNTYEHESNFFKDYWGKASLVERYLVEKFLRCGFTEVLARQTYDRFQGGPLTPRSDFSFITVENYPELKQLHEDAEKARNKHNNHVWNKLTNYLYRITFLKGLLKNNMIDAEYIDDVKKFIAYEERIRYLKENECFEYSPNGKKYSAELEKLKADYEKEFERTHPGYRKEMDECWEKEMRSRGSGNYAEIKKKYNYEPFIPERTVIENTTSIFFTVFRAHQKKVAAYHKSNGNYKNYARAMLRILDEHYQYKYDPGEEIFKENSYIFEFKQRFEIDLSSYREEETKSTPTVASPSPASTSSARKTTAKPRKKKEATKPVESATTVSEAPKKEPLAEPKKPSIPSKGEVRKYCLISESGAMRDFTGPMDYVQLPDGITAILGNTFKRVKDKLRVVIIPEGVRTIEANTFANCPNLEEVHLPESLTFIGEKAFLNCKKLKTINFPKALTNIDSYAFNGCESLKSADLPKDCFFTRNVYMMPFPQGCDVTVEGIAVNANIVEYSIAVQRKEKEESLNYLITAESIANSKKNLIMSSTVLQGIKAAMECVIVPNGINTVNPNCLKDTKQKLRLLVLPESITKIGKNAFKGLEALEEVRLPEELIHIGQYAFADCPKLKTVKFPSTLEKIDSSAFKGCTSLDKVIVPKECVYVKDGEYLRSFPATCKVIISGDIAEIIKEDNAAPPANNASAYEITAKDFSLSLDNLVISNGVLSGIKNELECVVIPDGVTSIEPNAFGYRSAMVRILVLPTTLKVVSKDVFREFSFLEEVRLNEGTTRIEASAFAYCKRLKTVVFPDSLEYIGNSAFKACESLKKVTLPKGCVYTNNKYAGSFPDTCEVVLK